MQDISIGWTCTCVRNTLYTNSLPNNKTECCCTQKISGVSNNRICLVSDKRFCGTGRKCWSPAFFSFSHTMFKRPFSHHCFNSFPNKPWFLCVCGISLLKTLWEKEKLLVTSNFSFSHIVFYPFKNFLPFSSNFKLLSADSFNLVESKKG